MALKSLVCPLLKVKLLIPMKKMRDEPGVRYLELFLLLVYCDKSTKIGSVYPLVNEMFWTTTPLIEIWNVPLPLMVANYAM